MDVDPTWLRSLASAEGVPSSPAVSVRPVLAAQLLALHSQRVKRRSILLPQDVAGMELTSADDRQLADVIDEEDGGTKPYQVLGCIGSGGMGVVHLARQRSTGREVAIKILKPAGDPLAAERFLREARAASAFRCRSASPRPPAPLQKSALSKGTTVEEPRAVSRALARSALAATGENATRPRA